MPSLIVHFKKPSGWSGPCRIHYWDTTPVVTPTTWPGVAMTAEANDWFVCEIAGVQAASIIFNDGSGRQTGNLRRDHLGLFYNSNWYDQNPEQPKIPEISVSPRARTYNTPQTVAFTSENGDDKIYYTLDGTIPTRSSTLYTGSITVSQTTTIHAFGVNSAGEAGQVRTYLYTIDPEADLSLPTVAANPTHGTYPAPIKVVATVTKDRPTPVTVYYTTDGSAPTQSSPVYVQGKAAGGLAGPAISISRATQLRFLAVDASGNEARTSFYYNIGEVTPEVDFREETIYFLLTTRFYDGDPSNNFFSRDRIKFNATTGEAEDPHWRGDFKGLIQRLDYIRELCFTAIWITAPVENRSGLDYHGYHPYDWTRVDPRLESPGATYQDLINEAHARNIKIVQDVVVNHSSQYGIRNQVWIDHLPIKYYVPQGSTQGKINNGPYQGNLGDYRSPFREDNDNPVAPDWFRARQTTDPQGEVPLADPTTQVSVPSPGYNPNRFFGVDANHLDSTWYHQEGFIMGGDWETTKIQTKSMAGDCISMFNEHPSVRDYVVNAISQYLDMGVDALRIDAAKHVERDSLLEFINAWKAYKPGLFAFGEVLVKGTGGGNLFGDDNAPSNIRPWWYTRLGDDPNNPNSGGDSGFSVLDFPLFSTFRDNLSRGTYGGIGGILARDWIYGDATKLVTFLQNHDVGPDNDFRFRFRGDQWMAAAAYNMLWTIRGIPCLLYGEEIEFMKGAPADVIGNNDTLDTTGRAYFGDHLTDVNIATTQSHPLYRHIQRLNLIRKSIPALQKGSMSQLNEWGGGMSFIRNYDNGASVVVVGLAIGGDQDITVG